MTTYTADGGRIDRESDTVRVLVAPPRDPSAYRATDHFRNRLRERVNDAVSEHATPPTMALLPLRRDVLEQSADRDMSSGMKDLLEDLYHELDSVDELDDVLRDE